MSVPSLSTPDILVLIAFVVVALVVLVIGFRLLIRAGRLTLKLGCALLILLLLAVGACVGWLLLT